MLDTGPLGWATGALDLADLGVEPEIFSSSNLRSVSQVFTNRGTGYSAMVSASRQ